GLVDTRDCKTAFPVCRSLDSKDSGGDYRCASNAECYVSWLSCSGRSSNALTRISTHGFGDDPDVDQVLARPCSEHHESLCGRDSLLQDPSCRVVHNSGKVSEDK